MFLLECLVLSHILPLFDPDLTQKATTLHQGTWCVRSFHWWVWRRRPDSPPWCGPPSNAPATIPKSSICLKVVWHSHMGGLWLFYPHYNQYMEGINALIWIGWSFTFQLIILNPGMAISNEFICHPSGFGTTLHIFTPWDTHSRLSWNRCATCDPVKERSWKSTGIHGLGRKTIWWDATGIQTYFSWKICFVYALSNDPPPKPKTGTMCWCPSWTSSKTECKTR